MLESRKLPSEEFSIPSGRIALDRLENWKKADAMRRWTDTVITYSRFEMSQLKLVDAINHLADNYDNGSNRLRFPKGFFTPGAIAVLTAFLKARGVPRENVDLPSETAGYFSAIGLPRVLWGTDDYGHERHREGKNYSSLEHLDNPEVTDVATSRINSCIRQFMGNDLPHTFVARLCEVVGDLHENVWAHGRSSGFSMAQKWSAAWFGRDHYLEFALADCGLGFLAEMRRVGMHVASDREAIEWCIQEGHSTKKLRPQSDWAQRMPEDVINNPLRGIEETRFSDNHHMGLGLFKLTQLVKEFRGELWLASGDAILYLAPDKENAYIALNYPWKGVALACRFKSSQIKRAAADIAADKDVEEIMQVLGGRHDRS